MGDLKYNLTSIEWDEYFNVVQDPSSVNPVELRGLIILRNQLYLTDERLWWVLLEFQKHNRVGNKT